MTTFGVGVGNFFGGSLIKLSGSEVPSIALSGTSYFFHRPLFAESEGWFYQDFLSYGFMVYLAIAIGFFVAWFMKHTRTGLHLRAVGENPNTADAASINVTKYKYMATCIGSMIAGLGGLYYVMDYASGVWSNNAFGDRGWLAIALVIFTIWRSNVGVFASILFGGLYILHMYIPTGSNPAVKELYKMLPYIVTIVVLCISLAVTPAFKMRFWNIGGEGQTLMGCLASASCMILLRDVLPNWALILVMLLTSMLAGAIWGGIPALFKAKWNTNETLFTLMMNYVATQLVAYFCIFWESPKGSGKIGIINQRSQIGWLPKVADQQYLLNIIVVGVLVLLMFLYLYYTKHGYEISVVGESQRTARYVGIKVEWVIIRTCLLYTSPSPRDCS